MLEESIEKRLIDILCVKEQWDYAPNLKTINDLWLNLRSIINENNKKSLEGVVLTDDEFEQIKDKLTFSSNFEAAKFLVGQNGIAHVKITRKDGKKVELDIFYRNSKFGNNVYQVANQIKFPKTNEHERDTRFDVTLLINGLPLIQIELKQQTRSEEEAYKQIIRYTETGSYSGIFRFLHMFVITNGANTKYFAAGSSEDLRKNHPIHWRDFNNNIVTSLETFAEIVLRKPLVYEMITQFSVLEQDTNSNSSRIILLRPYQIHAIKAVEQASKESRSGYVWHTTGSGKTLTSYKCTRNLINNIPSINKSIFLVDRKDLDNQTSIAFKAYAQNDIIDVEKTSSTSNLEKKLLNNERIVIVTTIQKLQRLITNLNNENIKGNSKVYNSLKSKRIAFVVDECHRTIPPERMFEIKKFFTDSLWYGFTGTPRFKENKYQNNGFALTTDELFSTGNSKNFSGSCLHKYTIENAIKDGAVLPLEIFYYSPNKDIANKSNIWHTEQHMLKVIQNILAFSNIRGSSNGKGKSFEGILTVSNIKIAQRYYELFQKVLKGEFKDKGIFPDQDMVNKLQDFPKIAISYSVKDDEDNTNGLEYNSNKMASAINDYNQMFGTNFSIDQIDAYNIDLQTRLKRIGPKYAIRDEQVDLVIVVNRLLTGFDAIPLCNLYIDRQPQELHTILQMFSRTNRIASKSLNKHHGNIIIFQDAVSRKKKVEETLKLFAAGGEKYALAKDFDELRGEYIKKFEFLNRIKQMYSDLGQIEEENEEIQKEFVKNVSDYERILRQLQTYVAYHEKNVVLVGSNSFEELNEEINLIDIETLPEFDVTLRDQFIGHYNSIIVKFRKEKPFLIEQGDEQNYLLQIKETQSIDIDYLTMILENVRKFHSDKNENYQKYQKELDIILENLRTKNPKLHDIIYKLVSEKQFIINNDKHISAKEIIYQSIKKRIEELCYDFASKYNLNYDALLYSAIRYKSEMTDSNDIIDIKIIIKDAKIDNVIPYQAKKLIKDELLIFFNNEILVLNQYDLF